MIRNRDVFQLQRSWVRWIVAGLVLPTVVVLAGCGQAPSEPSSERAEMAPERAEMAAERAETAADEPLSFAPSLSGDDLGDASPPPPMAMRQMPAPASESFQADLSQTAQLRSAYAAPAAMPEHLSHLPAGASRDAAGGFATVQVYYATDRMRDPLPLSAYELNGQKQSVVMLGGIASLLMMFALISVWRQRTRTAGLAATAAGMVAALAGLLITSGQAAIEKHGVTYNGDRGMLSRGICEVTVPDTHQRGVVERPTLLRFEIREDQQEHIVLTSAVELSDGDFYQRLADTVGQSPQQDVLVFIHGYNVDFQSAVRRTAQIAVDLPFEGVPVCYSWPSQGSLWGYSIDETNAEWTIANLKQFLVELSERSGARSINVVAHSMGNRAMTAAMQQIAWESNDAAPAPFERIVLAAPDVDADRFRRDLAPALIQVANQVTLYASSDDQALVVSKGVHGYPRAGESGENLVVVDGIETIDVSGIDLSLLGHSYYGDNEAMLRDLYEVVRIGLPAPRRGLLQARRYGEMIYWQLARGDTMSTSR